MPRDLPIGNGNVLIAFDKDYLLREFCYPHVGEENHTQGASFRFGIWFNKRFTWLPNGWQKRLDYLDDSLVTNVELRNDSLGLRFFCNVFLDFHEDIFIRKLTIKNLDEKPKELRLFIAQDFRIYGNEVGDTVAYRPEISSLLHYK